MDKKTTSSFKEFILEGEKKESIVKTRFDAFYGEKI